MLFRSKRKNIKRNYINKFANLSRPDIIRTIHRIDSFTSSFNKILEICFNDNNIYVTQKGINIEYDKIYHLLIIRKRKRRRIILLHNFQRYGRFYLHRHKHLKDSLIFQIIPYLHLQEIHILEVL